jgi:predicted MPP superfamily phosphohydrolase
MLLLQISDIHFQTPQCLNPDTDPDRGIRTRMMRHLRAQLTDLGRVESMLVGGDIAYKADPAEYEVAKKWLLELAGASGCSEDRIFVVPGNHDVNRAVIKAHMPTRNAQYAIASAENERREAVLRAQLTDGRAGHDLFFGHAAYNDFAAPMNCQVYPERIFWKQDIDLADGFRLRIHGLTSTLLSGQNGDNDAKNSLYLSPLQTSLDPVPDVVNLIMCHHPFDWFVDSDDVEDAINRRATLQLFGHKHRQRVHMEAEFVRWGAGAVNPSRDEKQYEPGYNLICLDVVGEGCERGVKVETRQFTYQSNPEGFHPIRTAQGEEIFKTVIPFPVDVVPTFALGTPALVSIKRRALTDGGGSATAEPAKEGDAEAAMGDEGTRNIVARFWDLAGSDRRELALELGLISPEEIALSEPERYGKALIRAKERGLIEELANRIAEREAQ